MNSSQFFKKFLKDNDIEMYSTHNEGKSVIVERWPGYQKMYILIN